MKQVYGHLNSIKVGSNEMPFTAWKHTERNRQRDRKKYVMIAGGFVILQYRITL